MVWVGQLLCKYWWSIFQVKKRDWSLGLASLLIAFPTNLFYLSRFLLCCSIWALIKGLNFLQEKQIRMCSIKISIKLYKDRLEMLKMRDPILNFFLLILKVLLQLAPGAINKSPRFANILSKKSLKFNLSHCTNFL